MGYTTDFGGHWTVTPRLSDAHREYLAAFATVRHMARDPELLPPDPVREAVGLPPGDEGAYYVGAAIGGRVASQLHTPDVIAGTHPSDREPVGVPGYWCGWVPSDDGERIEWDEGEKFYDYIEWIEYLMAHFLRPWGYALDGTVTWQGEEPDDRGRIRATDTGFAVEYGITVYVGRTSTPGDLYRPTAIGLGEGHTVELAGHEASEECSVNGCTDPMHRMYAEAFAPTTIPGECDHPGADLCEQAGEHIDPDEHAATVDQWRAMGPQHSF